MNPMQQTSSQPPHPSASSAVKYPKRLIEVDLPIRRISEHARKDQNIRKGHLHTIHVWWATRPLASCRAVIMATLLPDPADPDCPPGFVAEARKLMREWATRYLARAGAESHRRLVTVQKNPAVLDDPVELRRVLLDFIADFAAWDAGVDEAYLRTARALVAAAHPDGPPLVLDPFAGAGSIPFEALRVGAQAFAGDLNPVAVLINKVALEYLPRYGKAEVRMQKAEGGETITFHGLAEAVECWGKWVLEQARKRLAAYYPADSQGHIPLAYIWARTITCEGPGCGAEVPLLGMLWLSRKSKNLVALRYKGVKAEGGRQKAEVIVELFRPRSPAEVQPGIVNRMSATCPCCGYTTPYKSVREQLRKKRGGTMDARMVAVITLDSSGGRHFRLPEEADLAAAEKARRELDRIADEHVGPWPLVPDEQHCPTGRRWINTPPWGFAQWSDVYLPRQALALGTFCRLVGEAREKMLEAGAETAFADAVAACVALGVTNSAPMLCACSYYGQDHFRSVFQGSSLPMKPDFAEANPLIARLVGGVEYALGLVQAVVAREAGQVAQPGTAESASATRIPLPDDSAAYVVTDPPYYDAVGYSYLSDFCYVWLKRALGTVHPDLFATELTPKAEECILDPGPPAEGGVSKDRNYFEATMQAALADARRTLKPDGVGVVIFAHKSTAGWPREDGIWFLVRHGEPYKREGSLENGESTSVLYRPEKHDVVVYDPAIGEIRINARSKGEKELYRTRFGLHLFGDKEFFPGKSKYTLEPLRTDGKASLACTDIDGIEWIRLREVQFYWGGPQHEIETRKADDYFAVLEARGRSLPTKARIIRAGFLIKFADSKTP